MAKGLLERLYSSSPRQLVKRLGYRISPRPKSYDAAAATAMRQLLDKGFAGYTTAGLKNVSAKDLKAFIDARIGSVDAEAEGYTQDEVALQRMLSITFQWGHDHDFGDFALKGRMVDRHLHMLASFAGLFGVSAEEFDGKQVLDIGCWTGGTMLALASMGAHVHSIEEVAKYAETAGYLARAFGLDDRVTVENRSLYALNDPVFHDRFDVVHFPGVIYHVSDPVLALRILYNALKPGGRMLVESAGVNLPDPICVFAGNKTVQKDELSGFSWFKPTPSALGRMMKEAGLVNVETAFMRHRVFASGRKGDSQAGIVRAGLSVPDIR